MGKRRRRSRSWKVGGRRVGMGQMRKKRRRSKWEDEEQMELDVGQ